MSFFDNRLQLLIENARYKLLDGSRCVSPWLISPIRSLLDHERMGGHCYQRHVGKSLAELRVRLASEADISTASTFWNVQCATASICYLTVNNIPEIIEWACSTRRQIAIEASVPVRTSIGFAIVPGVESVIPCRRVRMVLTKDIGMDFHIVTAFPVSHTSALGAYI